MSEGAHYEAYICLLKLRGMSKGDDDRLVRLLLYVDRVGNSNRARSTGVIQIAVTTLLPLHSSSTLLSHLTLLDQTKGIWVSGLQLRSFNLAQLDHR